MTKDPNDVPRGGKAVSVGDLRAFLQEIPDDTEIVLIIGSDEFGNIHDEPAELRFTVAPPAWSASPKIALLFYGSTSDIDPAAWSAEG